MRKYTPYKLIKKKDKINPYPRECQYIQIQPASLIKTDAALFVTFKDRVYELVNMDRHFFLNEERRQKQMSYFTTAK